MNPEHLKILLIEDNPSDAELTIFALKEAKLLNEIVHLKNGEEALDYIFKRGPFSSLKKGNNDDTIGLILLDLKMPKVNGIEVLREIKANDVTKVIPVVVFTSSKENPDLEECYKLGVNSYIVKPVDFDQFSKVIKESGLYWILINKIPERKM